MCCSPPSKQMGCFIRVELSLLQSRAPILLTNKDEIITNYDYIDYIVSCPGFWFQLLAQIGTVQLPNWCFHPILGGKKSNSFEHIKLIIFRLHSVEVFLGTRVSPERIVCHRLPVSLLSYKTHPDGLWVTKQICKTAYRARRICVYTPHTHKHTHTHTQCRARRLISICVRVHPVQSQTHWWRSAALNRLDVRCWAVCDFFSLLMTKLLSLPPSPGGSLVVMVTSINTPAKLSGPPRLPPLLPPIPDTLTEDRWHVITAGDTSRKKANTEDASRRVRHSLKHFYLGCEFPNRLFT